MRLAEIGEFGLLSRLEKLVGHPSEQVVLGIGDDAALWQPTPGMQLAVTSDTQVANRHFLQPSGKALARWEEVGRRCAVVNLSDLAAMGANPCFALVSLGLPSSLEVESLEALYQGLVRELARFEAVVIGGNITSIDGPLFIDITLAGEVAPQDSLKRAGARVQDWIGVTGFPGRAAAGLCWLQREDVCEEGNVRWAELVQAYCRPEARVEAALAMAPYLHALIDVSDGLLADLGHLLSASRCGARLQKDALLFDPVLQRFAASMGKRSLDFLAGPSDDYELLFCVSPLQVDEVQRCLDPLGIPLHWMGEITSTSRLEIVDQEGLLQKLEVKGWTHF